MSASASQALQQLASPPQATADTTQTAPRDSTAFEQISGGLSEALRLAFEGEWQQLYALLYRGVFEFLELLLNQGVKAFVLFLLLYVVYRALDQALDRVLTRSKGVDAGLRNLLMKTYRATAFVFIGIMVLQQLDVEVIPLLAGLSIAGIAVGLAARDSMENFISGITILVDRPFRVGDYIEIDNEFGKVHEITLRSTRIQTVRNEIIVMPNTQMITQRLINHTMQNTLRVDVAFGIAYKERPDEAREVLLPIVADDDRILSRPEPSVIVTEMADSSVNMMLRFYLRDPSQEIPVRWEYTEKVRETLREADVEIPFPHRQLFLDEAKGLEGSTVFPPTNNGADDG
jgi:small conductance mechanosensitive channel